MFAVIFRATVRQLDDDYARTAAHLRALALREFGCLRFESIASGSDEVAISYWNSLADIQAWRSHPDHVAAQSHGREHWYAAYNVVIAEVLREYSHPGR